MKRSLLFFMLILGFLHLKAQSKPDLNFKWWNPEKSTTAMVDGQVWPKEVGKFYDRFPARAQQNVRKEVWGLSRNATGLKLRFKTTAKNIKIRYTVSAKNYAMDHFSATGKTGVDLYALNNDGSWYWANAKFKFGDTINYEYTNLDLDTENYKTGREFCIYLPTYNGVNWIEVGVPENAIFMPLPPRTEKPIVVYGTSIAQGASASRPGMAWTAILERDLNIPIVNLAFSGNGRLEPEVTSLVNEIDASIFVLDCLPNLNASTDSASLSVQNLIINAVKTIRSKHLNTPIILTDHSGFINDRLDASKRKALLALNDASAKAFKSLQQQGIKNIYTLLSSAINLGNDGTVDGTHPNDLGMYRYAKAYQQCIKAILKQQKTSK